MSSAKNRKKCVNILPHELESLKCIVLEERSRNTTSKTLKNGTWGLITDKFNSEIKNTKRTKKQLINVWKRLKRMYPSYCSSIRNEELHPSPWQRTPSSQNPRPQEECKEMDGLHDDQNVQTNLSDENGNFIDVDDIQDVYGLEDTPNPTYPSAPIQSDSRPTTSSEPLARPNYGISGFTANVERFEEEYLNTKMAYLKEEHQLKMIVSAEELQYWRRIYCNATQNSENPPLQQIPEHQTYHLSSSVNQNVWNYY